MSPVAKTAVLSIYILMMHGLAFASDSESCDFDLEYMLQLDQRSFDQSMDNGWRSIAQNDNCKLVAADLIREYIEANGENGRIMTWHEGQLRAMGGETERALALFRASKKPSDQDDWFGWNYYVEATVAFLEKDRPRLVEVQKRLKSLPRPENYSPVDSFGNPVEIKWPPNLNVVDGFLKCFEEDYDHAYNKCAASFTAVTKRD